MRRMWVPMDEKNWYLSVLRDGVGALLCDLAERFDGALVRQRGGVGLRATKSAAGARLRHWWYGRYRTGFRAERRQREVGDALCKMGSRWKKALPLSWPRGKQRACFAAPGASRNPAESARVSEGTNRSVRK